MANNRIDKTEDESSKLEQSILRRKVIKIIFLSLLMDLLAFTMPLPLFPRLIASFVEAEKSQSGTTTRTTLLSSTLHYIRACRNALISWKTTDSSSRFQPSNSKWDVTILGGILGSIFSFCQFLISPMIGKLSDIYGRKPILLMTMIGNMISAIIWLISTSFGAYVISRAVGGLSEGNVQLSIAVISDVSDASNRGKSLALVGIAFSTCFTLGPLLGAWLATRSPPLQLLGIPFNVYAVPALISFLLLFFETFYLAIALPETKHLKLSLTHSPEKQSKNSPVTNVKSLELRQKRLQILAKIHTAFLFFFSGAEFTLTFLTYDLYGFTNVQNGRLLGLIGILSSILQGGYIRRTSRTSEFFVKTGILSCTISMIMLSILPKLTQNFVGKGKGGVESLIEEGEIDMMSRMILYGAAAALAYVSATVVNSLNTLASLQCDLNAPSDSPLLRGTALGKFRSAGQLGRAFGPLFATALYWSKGPAFCYRVCALGALAVYPFILKFSKLNHHLTDQSLKKNI